MKHNNVGYETGQGSTGCFFPD